MLKRIAWWPGLGRDSDWWSSTCVACARIRAQPQLQIQGGGLEEKMLGSWLDIYMDFQGPFTPSVDGSRYILTYTCRLLRVPLLVACPSLQKDDAMQAVCTAFLRSLTVPFVIRHDRGQEFGSAVLQEFCALLGIDTRVPSPYRPMEISLGETIHREVNKQIALVLNELCKSYPQE